MGFSLTSPAPEKCDPTAKNRVWGFFGDAPKTSRDNRPQSLQPRRENHPTTTKVASGRAYWPSRDPIGERGGLNLYGMVGNDAVNGSDYLGLLYDWWENWDATPWTPQPENRGPVEIDGLRPFYICECEVDKARCGCCNKDYRRPGGILAPTPRYLTCGFVKINGRAGDRDKFQALLKAKLRALHDGEEKCAKEKCPDKEGGECRLIETRISDESCSCEMFMFSDFDLEQARRRRLERAQRERERREREGIRPNRGNNDEEGN